MEYLCLPRKLADLLLSIEQKADDEGFFDKQLINSENVKEFSWLKRLGCIGEIKSTEKPRITKLGFQTLSYIKYENEIEETSSHRFSVTTAISFLAIILSFASLIVSILK